MTGDAGRSASGHASPTSVNFWRQADASSLTPHRTGQPLSGQTGQTIAGQTLLAASSSGSTPRAPAPSPLAGGSTAPPTPLSHPTPLSAGPTPVPSFGLAQFSWGATSSPGAPAPTPVAGTLANPPTPLPSSHPTPLSSSRPTPVSASGPSSTGTPKAPAPTPSGSSPSIPGFLPSAATPGSYTRLLNPVDLRNHVDAPADRLESDGASSNLATASASRGSLASGGSLAPLSVSGVFLAPTRDSRAVNRAPATAAGSAAAAGATDSKDPWMAAAAGAQVHLFDQCVPDVV